MSAGRVQAEKLVMVNWRGVFFAPLDLDRHVTALEGDNGAGKTTALIATYVVLLPDLTRLRFTNLGEGEAAGGDRGIWGRLGDPGRPAYSWVRFRLPGGDSALFGVQLRKGAEPAVEIKPLRIHGLADDAPLQDALLHRSAILGTDEVPELEELRAAVQAAGGQLEVFKTAKDYFSALFELGVTPMRLTGDDARKRFNEVLRTSMTGGLSRGLTRDLRRFVLEAEDTLGSTLTRMQTNLDACHRSRLDVERAGRLQREIGAVYAAGRAMFEAAMAEAREGAEAAGSAYEARVAEAERLRTEAQTIERQDETLAAREAVLSEQIDDAREILEKNRARRDRVRRGWELVKQVNGLEQDQPPLDAAVAAGAERVKQADIVRSDARARRTERRRLLDEASRGLHDAEAGLEGLQGRVARHQRAHKSLAEARARLSQPELAPDDAAAARPDVQAARTAVDDERRALRREIDTAAQRRAEFDRALAALSKCVGDTAPEGAYAAAQGLLADARARESLRARAPALARDVRLLEDVQRRLGRLADRLAKAFPDAGTRPTSAADFDGVQQAAEAAAREAQITQRSAQASLVEAEAARSQLAQAYEAARRTAARALSLRETAATLSDGLEAPPELDHAEALRTLHEQLERRAEALAETLRVVEAEGRTIGSALVQLDEAGRGLSADFQAAADLVGGAPLRARFDDVSVEEAPSVEARLGPLVDALVVDDAYDAAEAWPPGAPGPVWFVEGHTAQELVRTGGGAIEAEGDAGVLARFGEAWRLTQPPASPVVGRAARAALRAEQVARREALDRQADELRRSIAEAQAARRRCAALLPEADLLDVADPAGDLAAAESALDAAKGAVEAARAARAEAEHQLAEANDRLDALRACAPDAALLDEPDPSVSLAQAKADAAAVQAAVTWLDAHGKAIATVQASLATLQWVPPGPEALIQLEARLAAADGERDRLDAADEALRAFAEVRDAYEDDGATTELAELRLGHADARKRVESARVAEAQAEAAVEAAEANLDAAREAHLAADRLARGHAATLDAALSSLRALGVGRPEIQDLEEAEAAVTAANEKLEGLHDKERAVSRDRGTLAAQRTRVGTDLTRAQADADAAQAKWAPLRERLTALRVTLSANGLAEPEQPEGRINARVQRATLVERLRRAQKGDEVLEAVTEAPSTPEGDVEAWIATRAWLRRCLPSRLAETTDPRQGLERLNTHLAGLEARLQHQERVLAGSAEDVAHFVRQLRRRARRQISRLNELLGPISFGAIAGVRLEMTDIPQMEQLLDGLSAQQELFKPNLPIDQALDELFTRVGGRGGDGKRLFDYREYFDLQVRVRRRSEDAWRVANPTKMSTGEAIGVGAALMMVVLHAWEAQNQLARQHRDWGTLRLLFLDEANRLSSDNLGVLFELCRTLDLQLLIAAPTVDEAAGNTTYRLTRITGAGQDEEVRFSGRRLRHTGLTEPPPPVEPALPGIE